MNNILNIECYRLKYIDKLSNKIRIPAEWEEHRAIWTCWPSDKELWLEDIEPARAEIAAMIKALITPHNGKFDKVKLLVSGEEAFSSARAALPEAVEIFEIPFGDIWLRDTGPIFAKDGDNNIALCFGFNGWGGKYVLDYDDEDRNLDLLIMESTYGARNHEPVEDSSNMLKEMIFEAVENGGPDVGLGAVFAYGNIFDRHTCEMLVTPYEPLD